MHTNLSDSDRALRQEADTILFDRGLHSLLQSFGMPHYTGSYVLQLMTWRDLDVYLETGQLDVTSFFELGSRIAALLNPVKMSFRNETVAQTEGLPHGLYWGVYLGDERNGAWKIDVWAMRPEECQRRLAYCARLGARISAAERECILDLKSQCWRDPAYRKVYSSGDIYAAVLEHGVRDIEGFKAYLAGAKG